MERVETETTGSVVVCTLEESLVWFRNRFHIWFSFHSHALPPIPFCSPYKNAWLIASQLAQILAVVLAYKFLGILFVGIAAMLLQQLLWCCKQTSFELLTSTMLSFLAAGLTIWSGAYFLLEQKHNNNNDDWCQQPVFYFLFWNPVGFSCGNNNHSALLAFGSAFLWLASAACTILFVLTTERRDKNIVGIALDDDDDDDEEMYNCEMGRHRKHKRRDSTYKTRLESVSSGSISKSEQFAPPTRHNHNKNRNQTFECATKSEQFAPPKQTSTRNVSQKASICSATKSEQFAPPEIGTKRNSRNLSVTFSISEQFFPPEEVVEEDAESTNEQI